MKNISKYPLIGFKNNDSNIYVFDRSNLGIVSKNQGKFYNGLFLIDSEGMSFKVKNWKHIGYASFIECLKHFQLLQKLELELIFSEQISLNTLKMKILEKISKSPKKFDPHFDGTPLIEKVKSSISFEELILLFK